MQNPNLDLTTTTIKGMAGEPMEIIIYLYQGKKITKDEWIARATEEDVRQLNNYEKDIEDSNEASAVSWCI